MAKRELSTTLKNLKFMQRGANKGEKTKKEEVIIPDGNFPSFISTKKCMVIMEGDPSPGAIRGRISFLSFNPFIDKLNEPRQSDDDARALGIKGKRCLIENDEPVSLNSNKANGDLKRKQVEYMTEVQLHNKLPNIIEGNQSSSSNNRRKRSHKPHK